MAEKDTTTDQAQENQIKKEAWAAMGKVKLILDGLAAIAVLRIQAANEREGSDLPPIFWRDLYKDSPWVVSGEEPQGELPVGLEEGLNRLIFKQTAQAWEELSEGVGRIFTPEDYRFFTAREGESKEDEA